MLKTSKTEVTTRAVPNSDLAEHKSGLTIHLNVNE